MYTPKLIWLIYSFCECPHLYPFLGLNAALGKDDILDGGQSINYRSRYLPLNFEDNEVGYS